MLGAGDDLVLQRFGDVAEVIAVACNPDDEAAILLGRGLCVAQRIGADNIKLHVVGVHLEVAPDELRHPFDPDLSFEQVGRELHVQQRPAGLDVVHLPR